MMRVILTKIDALFSDHNQKNEQQTCLNRKEEKRRVAQGATGELGIEVVLTDVDQDLHDRDGVEEDRKSVV